MAQSNLSMKRPRSDSDVEQENMTWEKPYTMIENLQGSTAKLTSTLKALSQSIDLLKSFTPDIQRLTMVSQMERRYEMVTEEDIKEAQTAVANETTPEINVLLNEAQLIIDQLGKLSAETERKVDAQDETLKSQKYMDQLGKGTHMSPVSGEDQAIIMDLQKRTKRYQLRQETLLRESSDCDVSLAELEMELANLDKKIDHERTKGQQKKTNRQQKTLEIDQQNLALEQRQLEAELEALDAQLQDQRRKETLLTTSVITNVEVESPVLSKGACEQHLNVMQTFLDHLRADGNARHPINKNELQRYLEAIEHDQVKFIRPTHLERVMEKNIQLLKIYCKTLMTKDNMGFVGQRLVDILFTTKDQALTRESLLKEFGSSRQKELVERILEAYNITFKN